MTARNSLGHEAEQLLRAFEEALAETDLLGRHADPDEEPEHLRELREHVVAQVSALPAEQLPRPRCANCDGEGEVSAVHIRREAGESAPEVVTGRRLCPNCWGTGLTLRHTEQAPKLDG